MEILEAAMAFAVAMIIFSTMATGVVEVLLRFTHTKSAFLHQSVKKMLNDMVQSQFAESDRPNGTQVEEAIEALTVNPARKDEQGWVEKTWIGAKWIDWTDKDQHRYRIDALSTLAFAKRLSETDLGAAIAKQVSAATPQHKVEAAVADKFKEWQGVYERYRATSNERFRKNAQSLTVVVAIAMALVFNIHAGRLFVGVMSNEGAELREKLVAQAELANEENQETQKQLEDTLAALDKAVAEGADPEVTKDLQTQIRQLQDLLTPDDTVAMMPVGSAYFPHCHFTKAHHDADSCTRTMWDIAGWGQWLVNALLAGVLIGLGGPFWYRVFSSLSQLTQALKAFGSRKGGSAEMLGGTAQLRPEQLPDDAEDTDLSRAANAALTRSSASNG